jgi:histidine ammonia-lyase
VHTDRIEVGNRQLTIVDVLAVAYGQAPVHLSDSADWRQHIEDGAAFLQRLWENSETVYGVTTGYGESCDVDVSRELVEELPLHLTRFHGCGMGKALSQEAVMAVLTVRLSSLAVGYSGVRFELLERLAAMINHGVLPVIPEEGSVGASGDLTPLSYVAAVIMGEREVMSPGGSRPAAEVLAELGWQPLMLRPKEGLAIMNGTAVMTALACLAYQRAQYLAQLSCRLTAMSVDVLRGNGAHFAERLFEVKPFPGQSQAAAWIRGDLHCNGSGDSGPRLQDRYSLRCAPHIIGVLLDSLPWMRQWIEIELNSANDNPIIDPENDQILHGGHFYGGHIAFAMDSMKNAVANIADLLDRQLALMMDRHTNHGLPANLSGAEGDRAAINHGFKAVQIGASAWTAEALKHTMPASVFSRSTECHNQDKVSMGTIAARDCLRVLELTEQVAAASLLANAQGMQLRLRRGDIGAGEMQPAVAELLADVESFCGFIDEDRSLEGALRQTVSRIRSQHWTLFDGA